MVRGEAGQSADCPAFLLADATRNAYHFNMSDERNPFEPECWSCGRTVTPYHRDGVPSGVDCCFRCWSKVSVAERLKIVVAIRDREPGGFLSELAELVMRSIERGPHKLEDDGE